MMKKIALLFFLCCAASVSAQTIPHVTGTFKTPEGKTPLAAGLKSIAKIKIFRSRLRWIGERSRPRA